MNKAVKVGVAVLLTILLDFMPTATAENLPDFASMDNEINSNPWQSYQKIISLNTSSYTEQQYLWWLVRRAQIENLVYFYDEFDATILNAKSLVNVNTPLEIQTRLNLLHGISLQRQGNYQASEVVLAKSLHQAQKADLKRLYVYGKQELAYTKTLTELFETSLADIQEAYVEAFALEDQYLIATINETYGAIYGYLNDYEKSIEYYQRAFESYKSLSYPAHIAEAVYGLASTYRYWKKYDLAIEYFELYGDKIDYTPNSNILFFSAYGIGMTYAEGGNCKLAIAKINEALKLKGLLDYNAELYKRKASCLIELGQLTQAEDALFQAAKAFSELPELLGTRWQLEVIKISGELAYKRGDFELAHRLTSQYYQEYSKLQEKNSSQRLLKVRASLEVERQQVAQALEAQRSQVEILEGEKQNSIATQQRYFNIFVVCLIAIIFVVMIYQYRTNAKMRLLAIQDGLSGLYNRRHIFACLDKLFSSTENEHKKLAILLIDVDDFKEINDTYGHPVGDIVIKKIAELGQSILRKGDIMGRIGGEEFLCILPHTSEAEAKSIASRLLTLIGDKQLVIGESRQVTVSIGIACLTNKYEDVNQLYVNADEALYRAKNNGKNQVEVF